MKRVVSLVLILVVFVPIIWVLVYKFEGKKPVVDIKLTRIQLNKIRNKEYLINVKDLQGGHQYPKRVLLLEKTGLNTPIFVGPYTPTLRK